MNNARIIYKDIICREHHVSQKRQPMPRLQRAAQFAPFAALTGYDDMIREAGRYTDEQTELDEGTIRELNDKLIFLLHRERPTQATFTCFIPDRKKAGGSYVSLTDSIARYDEYHHRLTLGSGLTLPIEHIVSIEGDVFDVLNW